MPALHALCVSPKGCSVGKGAVSPAVNGGMRRWQPRTPLLSADAPIRDRSVACRGHRVVDTGPRATGHRGPHSQENSARRRDKVLRCACTASFPEDASVPGTGTVPTGMSQSASCAREQANGFRRAVPPHRLADAPRRPYLARDRPRTRMRRDRRSRDGRPLSPRSRPRRARSAVPAVRALTARAGTPPRSMHRAPRPSTCGSFAGGAPTAPPAAEFGHSATISIPPLASRVRAYHRWRPLSEQGSSLRACSPSRWEHPSLVWLRHHPQLPGQVEVSLGGWRDDPRHPHRRGHRHRHLPERRTAGPAIGWVHDRNEAGCRAGSQGDDR